MFQLRTLSQPQEFSVDTRRHQSLKIISQFRSCVDYGNFRAGDQVTDDGGLPIPDPLIFSLVLMCDPGHPGIKAVRAPVTVCMHM